MLCYATLCYAVVCCAVLCCAVLCCAMLYAMAPGAARVVPRPPRHPHRHDVPFSPGRSYVMLCQALHEQRKQLVMCMSPALQSEVVLRCNELWLRNVSFLAEARS